MNKVDEISRMMMNFKPNEINPGDDEFNPKVMMSPIQMKLIQFVKRRFKWNSKSSAKEINPDSHGRLTSSAKSN